MQPLTFAALSGHKVITGLWDEAGTAEAPTNPQSNTSAKPNRPRRSSSRPPPPTPGKFAHGIADDFLTTMYLATPAPVLVAPAMNVNMWDHPATQANLEILRQRGVRVIEPGTGELACGMVGAGRMAEPEAIAEAVLNALGRRHDLAGEVVLVTAGGTREALDPVRFLGNRSSGKMGYAIAEAAQAAAPASSSSAARPPSIRHPVASWSKSPPPKKCAGRAPAHDGSHSHHQGRRRRRLPPSVVSEQKLKRTGPLTVELAPTEDILAEVVRRRRPGQLIVGFAAETENRMENGRAKLLRKGADAIVVNDVSGDRVGIDSDLNAATFLTILHGHRVARDDQAQARRSHPRRDRWPSAPASAIVEVEGLSPQDEVLHQSASAAAPRRQIIVE